MVTAQVHANLGRDDDLTAHTRPRREPIADNGFGLAAFVAGHPARIDVCRIDEVTAGGDKGVKQRK